jgi:hypothetical protein
MGSRRKRKDLAWFALGGALMLVPLVWVLLGQRNVYGPPLLGACDVYHALASLPGRLFTHLTGAYFLYYDFTAPFWTRLAAGLWLGLIVISGAAALWRWRKRRTFTFAEAAVLGLLATIGCTVPMNYISYGSRYLLPLSGLFVIIFSEQLARCWAASRRARLGAGLLMLTLVVLCGFNEADWVYPLNMSPTLSLNVHQREVEELAGGLLEHNIRHVYCLDTMLQYRLIFATRERLIARSYSLDLERQLQCPLAVERARLSGVPTVLIGQLARLKVLEDAARRHGTTLAGWQRSGPMLFVLANPSPQLLTALDVKILPDMAALQKFVRDQAVKPGYKN